MCLKRLRIVWLGLMSVVFLATALGCTAWMHEHNVTEQSAEPVPCCHHDPASEHDEEQGHDHEQCGICFHLKVVSSQLFLALGSSLDWVLMSYEAVDNAPIDVWIEHTLSTGSPRAPPFQG